MLVLHDICGIGCPFQAAEAGNEKDKYDHGTRGVAAATLCAMAEHEPRKTLVAKWELVMVAPKGALAMKHGDALV